MSAAKKIGGDKAIWIVVIALAIFSFLPVYSASSNFGVNLIFSNIIKHVSIIFIGIVQILSLVPGVSRAGITITAARIKTSIIF